MHLWIDIDPGMVLEIQDLTMGDHKPGMRLVALGFVRSPLDYTRLGNCSGTPLASSGQ